MSKKNSPSYKSWMTFADKGEVFFLYDSGKNVEEISEITGYSPSRLRWMIEGVIGTSAWVEAITTYQEVNNYGENDKGHRDVRQGYIGPPNTGSKRSVSTRRTTKDVHKRQSYRGIGGTASQVAAHQGAKRPVSKSDSGPSNAEFKPADRGVQVRNKSRRQGPKSVIDKMRDHVDYKGE